jgi:hypothetical protein
MFCGLREFGEPGEPGEPGEFFAPSLQKGQIAVAGNFKAAQQRIPASFFCPAIYCIFCKINNLH